MVPQIIIQDNVIPITIARSKVRCDFLLSLFMNFKQFLRFKPSLILKKILTLIHVNMDSTLPQ